MKVKLGNLKSIIEGLTVLASQQLPIKNQYWIGKTLAKLTKEYQEVETNRYKLCMKHSQKDEKCEPITKEENGQKVYVMSDQEAFNNELFELWNEEIDIKFTPIPLEQLEGVKVDMPTIMKLGGFIIGEEETITDGNHPCNKCS